MNQELMIEQLFSTLICGNRVGARRLSDAAHDAGVSPETLTHDVYWPALEMIEKLYRADQLTCLAHHYATRLLRSLVDQAQTGYEQKERRGSKVLMFCGPGETDELAAQIVADLSEADGYEIFFGGGGVANDEILAEVGEQQPDILLMFSSAPSDAPNIRQLIDTVHGVDSCPGMQIVVGGGVFNRAEGLAEEIGADVWAKSPRELLEKLVDWKDRRATAEQRTVGRNRRVTSAPAAEAA
ncbi:MAG: cobalamin-dependent protein [Planctomycetota bacterium]|nr:cobalamin-dependent protein [Planctomycetota bacterium]